MDTKNIVVIGAGPAGMMAAIRAGELHQKTILIEKNPTLGRKLLLSGKGRCNLTNVCGLDSFIERFSGRGQFLRDAFKKFFNADLMRFFEERGVKLKVERQLRVFPESNKSDTILKVLSQELQKNKVRVVCKNPAKDILIEGDRVKGVLLKNGKIIPADRVILATGGVSFSFTGSSGEGIGIAKKLGHRIVSLRAGLVPLETKETYVKLLEGLTLKNIRLKFSSGKKELLSEIGELLFTSSGISGPLVLSLSGKVVDWLEEHKSACVDIDLKPALSPEQLDNRLLREFKLSSGKSIKGILKSLLTRRMVGVFTDILKINPDKKVSQITQMERKSIISLLKNFRLDILRPKPIEDGMVTRGGVSLRDINPRTMESRIIKGLYFAGEIMDIDADTGGFNLQAAFSTGYLAGDTAAIT